MVLFGFYIVVLYISTSSIRPTASVQITKLYVPRRASHEAPMDCQYDLEDGALYDVKWYKDEQQFYRCAGNGSVQEFAVDGVQIWHPNFATVGSCPLKLTSLSANSSGEYTCEVTLDAPNFKTVSQSANFEIIQILRRTHQDDGENNVRRNVTMEKVYEAEKEEISSSAAFLPKIIDVALIVLFILFILC